MNNAFFILLPGAYLAGAIMYQGCFSFLGRVDNKVIIITASACSLFACLLCGPSQQLYLPDDCAFIAVGFGLMGFTCVIIGIPLIAEQNAMTIEYFGEEKAKTMSDLNASVFAAS